MNIWLYNIIAVSPFFIAKLSDYHKNWKMLHSTIHLVLSQIQHFDVASHVFNWFKVWGLDSHFITLILLVWNQDVTHLLLFRGHCLLESPIATAVPLSKGLCCIIPTWSLIPGMRKTGPRYTVFPLGSFWRCGSTSLNPATSSRTIHTNIGLCSEKQYQRWRGDYMTSQDDMGC